MQVIFRTALGQDHHRFSNEEKPLRIAGIDIDTARKLEANSDGDVVLHAITNAISGITTKNILGKAADDLCQSGITDSSAYLKLALDDLKAMETVNIVHLSISIEALKPKLSPHMERMRQKLSELLEIEPSSIGITATTGEGLTGMGQGLGIGVLCVLTVSDRLD